MNILLTPARIGGVEIKNRIVMPPMTTRLADRGGFVTDDTVNYYMARVRGGVGLITCEMASPEKCGRHRFHELGIYDDRFCDGLARLTAAIHGGGLENRARFGLEVLRAVKAAAGDMPVIYRISVEDYFPDGMPFAEGRQIALWAAEAGADALHVAAGHYRSLPSGAMQLPPMTYPDGIWLDYAASIRAAAGVPVIAVGRLGDPQIAEAAIAGGKADFIALGRTSVAEPDWAAKLGRGETPRRCLACNTCINEMRGGARIGCVVNGMAGRETEFSGKEPLKGTRIAVIGAGPAGLSYAALVASGNEVTVFEREPRAGGAFRYAGLAPLFQEVDANPRSFALYIERLVARCVEQGVTIRYGVDVARAPDILAPFERIVVATGARYRFGMGPIVTSMLESGFARLPAVARLFAAPRFRDWFYYRARKATGGDFSRLAGPDQTVIMIGDARRAAKSKDAISSAFEAAYGLAIPPRPSP